MLELCLVRHGHTPCNAKGCYCGGGCNAPLTEVGQAMAEAIAERLASTPWQAVYSSPQQRALKTAEPLASKQSLPVHEELDLRELEYGRWDGQTPSALSAGDPKKYAAWLEDPSTVAPPDGETAEQVAERVTAFLQRVRDHHHRGPVVVFSHKSTIRILACTLLDIPLRSYRRRVPQPLGALTVFELEENSVRPVCLGDISHLPQDLRARASV